MNSHNSEDLGSLFPVAVNPPMAVSPANLHGAGSHANEQDWSPNLFGFVGQQIDADLGFLNTAPGLLSRENSLCSCLGSGLIKAIDGGNVTANKPNSDGGISQLSQMSNHLASLHRTSSADANKTDSAFQFRDPSQERASSLVNDAAFKSVACWLVDVSADGNGNFLSCEKSKSSALEQSSAETLYHVFSASYQFLETLRGLQDRTFGRAHGGISRDAWTDFIRFNA